MNILILQWCVFIFHLRLSSYFWDSKNTSIFFNIFFYFFLVESESSWYFGESNQKQKIPTVFKSVKKNKQNLGKTEIYTQNQFLKESWFGFLV